MGKTVLAEQIFQLILLFARVHIHNLADPSHGPPKSESSLNSQPFPGG